MNDLYKLQHAPKRSEKLKFHQGYYTPVNKEKCLTAQNVFRSSWEFQFMRWCDMNPEILFWASEPLPIPYLDPVGNLKYCMENGLNPNDPHNWKRRTYYTDFWIEQNDPTAPDGKRRTFIEIKPFSQTQPPTPLNESATLKEHKKYNNEAQTYLTNQAKWTAAKKYCEDRGALFKVITEKTLKKMGLL